MEFLSKIITWDPEVMSKALMNTAMGISIVFIVLIMISLIISLFQLIPKIQEAFSKKSNPADEVKQVKPEVAPVVAAKADNSNELIAVIAAAIAASTGASTDSFVVRSIKRRR